MAEFCLECWNRITETNNHVSKYIISEDLELCEGCKKLKNVIVMKRKHSYLCKFLYIVSRFKTMGAMLHTLWRK